MRAFQAVVAALFAVLLFGVVKAIGQRGFADGVAWLTSEWWGTATVIDVYVGFAFVAAWLWLTESRKWLAVLLIANLLWLGNLVTLAVLFARSLRRPTVRAVFFG
jgi:hypothetical protein